MADENLRDSEGGNKIFLFMILALCVLILVLLLLMVSGVLVIAGGPAGVSLSMGGAPAAGLCKTTVCDGAACSVESVDDCCGNGLCEEGETAGSCPMDCAPFGGIVVNSDSDGNTYNEYNSGGEVVCHGGSNASGGGISATGVFCVCTETDCGDGVDNDGDGYTDCYDPDCNCFECEDCPPCDNHTNKTCEDECGRYPSCGGSCRLDSGEAGTCIAGDDGCCHCNVSSYPCESLDGMCEFGTCPPGQRCELQRETTDSGASILSGCGCVPEENYSCSDMDTAYCSRGTCPPGQVCEYTAGECSCVEETLNCEDSYELQCTGECPAGRHCVLEYGAESCKCVKTDCEDADFPACQGDCPKNQHCEAVQTDECTCVDDETTDGGGNPGCAEMDDWPACQGDCPPGESCVAMQNSCECQPQSCNSDNYPFCNASCPEGQVCEIDREYKTCSCVYESSGTPCGSLESGCEEGVCDSGERCAVLGPLYCDCIPEDDYSCSHVADTAYCSVGDCPPGQYCTIRGNSCDCANEE